MSEEVFAMAQQPEPPAITIESLTEEQAHQFLSGFADLLRESVLSGASVGYLPPFPVAESRAYWESVLPDIICGKRVLLAAMRDGHVLGSVQLELATKANATHRAEVQKLLVLMEARNNGLGRRLMLAAEEHARSRARSLLVLDTQSGSVAHGLYRRLGYTEAGSIPGYALSPEGPLPTTILYKHLDATS
jgi:ribosomal protein S18 acetylase RimI-like enzyme